MAVSQPDSRVLETLFNHVVLPERLPSKPEDGTHRLEEELVDSLIHAARTVADTTSDTDTGEWEDVRKTLIAAKELNNNRGADGLDKDSLLSHFRRLGRGESLILHVKEQNAGLLVRRTHDSAVEFETFEASPSSQHVLAAEGALQCGFPGAASAIALDVFTDESFQDSLADFLEQCSCEMFADFASHTSKAGAKIMEPRNSADPAMVSQLLMTILEALGRKISPPFLYKRIRDDVIWDTGSEIPWRRAPYWLVLRVGLARHLDTKFGSEAGRARYKILLCVSLTLLLRRSVGVVKMELLHNLRAKLSRRLAKLHTDRKTCAPSAAEIYSGILPSLEQLFHSALRSATECIDASWNEAKRALLKPICSLPSRADRDSLRLGLPSSGTILESILAKPFLSDKTRKMQEPPDWCGGTQAARETIACYSRLANIERETEDGTLATALNGMSDEKACLTISTAIGGYLDQAGSAYDGFPELQSIKLLTVMEMWMLLDRRATTAMNLLMDYATGIPAAALDVLQLPSGGDMRRLQAIQDYLRSRQKRAGSRAPTLFIDPSAHCFAVRYYNECDHARTMAELFRKIRKQEESARSRTMLEWKKLSKKYEDLSIRIAQTPCMCGGPSNRRKHNVPRCMKCKIKQERKKIRMNIHEDFLPKDEAQGKTVVFELRCPPILKTYRAAVWSILIRLGYTNVVALSEPTYDLRNYANIAPFRTMPDGEIILASRTKSHLNSHYKRTRLPLRLDEVLRPHGMVFSYQDATARTWCAQKTGPSFAHLCQWMIPQDSPLAQLQAMPGFSVDGEGPSSNDILAAQTRCPNGLSVHEFTAVQSLFSGKRLRWPSILIELGSSNLNFSNEATVSIIAQLAAHAGPADPGDPLRIVHSIFHDRNFCARLIDQIAQRLDVVASNWREAHMMDLLITLLLRLISLAAAPANVDATQLLERARGITNEWMGRLRREMHQAADCDVSQKLSRQLLWAALLCRRACATCADKDAPLRELKPQALRCFIEASIAVQENFDSNPAALSGSLRLALLRDIRSRGRMSSVVRSSIKRNPGGLTTAIDNVWPSAAGGEKRRYSQAEFVHWPSGQLIRLKVDHRGSVQQQVLHYDPVDGGLFIDGKSLSQLPAEYRDNWILKELFGNQNLLTYPSYMAGMDYTMNYTPAGHQIHFGIVGKALVIRARHHGHTLQLIPRDVFGSLEKPDLPASLVEGCIHWMDLTTGIIEVRQKPDIWVQKDSNWTIDVRCRLARRRRVFLVDPRSLLFDRVASIFRGFEDRARLTVYQPEAKKGSLSVELRRLDLNFYVNEKGRLYCRELQAEVDPDQDAGTWYGFDSKIVLRDGRNARRRKILVPLGPLSWTRRGTHVAIHAENGGNYGIFAINSVLGRLECPAEARLVLFKALLHAYTASIVPDPLTRRGGTEEALHCLRSAQNQPWMPLNPMVVQYLSLLASLTPTRVYYPPGRKAMQQVFWDDRLPAATQHEAFRAAVAAIQRKSEQLSVFWSAEPMALPSLEDAGGAHLRRRSGARRSVLGRVDPNCVELERCRDVLHRSRDRQTQSDRRAGVLESTALINTWRATFPVTPNLAALLQGWPAVHARGEVAPRRLFLTSVLGVDAAAEWGSWLGFCRRARVADKYMLCFTLGALAFQHAADMDLVRILIAFAILEDLKGLELPPWTVYGGFKHGEAPSADYLLQLMSPSRMAWENGNAVVAGEHQEHVDADYRRLADFLASRWPRQLPSAAEVMEERFASMDVPAAMELVTEEWVRLRHNAELSSWVSRAQIVLDQLHVGTDTQVIGAAPDDDGLTLQSHRERDVPCLEELLPLARTVPTCGDDEVLGTRDSREATLENGPTERASLADESNEGRASSSSEMQQLKAIIARITSSKSAIRQLYGKDLNLSLQALEATRRCSIAQEVAQVPAGRTDGSVEFARKSAADGLENISTALDASDSRVAWLKHGGLWPCISPVTLLERLRMTAKVQFGVGMKDALVAYGRAITALQQQLRIDDAWMREDSKAVAEEAANPGHETWHPAEYPDWLLIEIDGNFLIRPHQVDVALSTISPPSGDNSVLQMNMGQGKTSCIVPMITSVIADAQRLVRVVVPRALLAQTAQVLQARLGGLPGREVRSVPFSRRTPTTVESVGRFIDIHRDIMSGCGIIVTLPENLLSFKLSVTQRLLDGKTKEAACMIEAQKWMEKVSRDVLDECDFTLATRTQLIYPSGPQTSLDGHPFRWQTAQTLLELVRGHLDRLKDDFPRSIEVVDREGGGFPWLFFLRSDAENALVRRIVDHIACGKTRLLSLTDCSQADCNVVRRFIGEIQPQADDERRVEAIFPEDSSSRKTVYLLRGLLAHGILVLALKKRWNVQYGLHPLRDPVSVPYHAKGVPSDQAEWGHPDVAILLTCLSFYFAGLGVAQLQKCVLHILQADDPAGEYGRWVGSSKTLPCHLQEWNVLNVDDELQLHELWTHLRYNVSVIGCFLNQFVFPVHAKQFRTQIHASGWDIPLQGKRRLQITPLLKSKHIPLTTGFSGTNDNRYLLPLTIEQHDLAGLVHTNADVLTYLLQPQNLGYVLAASRGRRFSEEALLRKIQELEIRVLIDAGAQVLEMDNLTLVKTWMRIDPKAKAALYFNTENKPFILSRSGSQVPLLASSMANNLSECLVYLDEAHTRGTDLKLPPNARGALTLGMGQTKDHTVQAAMRLRQLATTQSIVFFAPPEVHQSILDDSGRGSGWHPNSRDVVQWLLEQTCRGIEQLQPIYNSQGIDFYRRSEVSMKFPNNLVKKKHRKAFVKEIRHVESQTLQEMYRPRPCEKPVPTVLKQPSQATAAQLAKLKGHGYNYSDQAANAISCTALQEVEQEREVAHEVEAVRKVQQPTYYKALPYGGLHEDILHFETTGRLKSESNGYELLSSTISRTSTGRKHNAGAELFSSQILVSREFSTTVELEKPDDTFMRPVNWLLWSPQAQTALLVTPEEVEDLIPRKHVRGHSMTHLLMYAAPVARRMLHFSKLDYYAIPNMSAGCQVPKWLAIQLGLFAGRLYFDFDEYDDIIELVKFGTDLQRDGSRYGLATEEETVHQQPMLSSTNSKLLAFLHEWMAVRRKGQESTHTPMGYLCEGKPLSARHPFFSRGAPAGPTESPKMHAGWQTVNPDADSSDERNVSPSVSEADFE